MSGFYATIFIKVHEQETQMASYNTKMKVCLIRSVAPAKGIIYLITNPFEAVEAKRNLCIRRLIPFWRF